jgi:hypothetical protein
VNHYAKAIPQGNATAGLPSTVAWPF